MEAEKEVNVYKLNAVPTETRMSVKVDQGESDYTVVTSAVVKGEAITLVAGPYVAKDKEELSWAMDKVSADLKAILVDKL